MRSTEFTVVIVQIIVNNSDYNWVKENTCRLSSAYTFTLIPLKGLRVMARMRLQMFTAQFFHFLT